MTPQEAENQVRQTAADVFNLPLDQITRDLSPRTVEHWDSVQQLNFVLALEAAFSIQLEPEEIEKMLSIGAAIDLVRKRLLGIT